MPTKPFKAWQAEVEVALGPIGLSAHDLPDIDYWGLWVSGAKASTAAALAISEAGGDAEELLGTSDL